MLVYLPKSITALYGEQLRRHASDLPLTLINAIQLLFIPAIEFLLGKPAQTPNIPYLLVRHIPFTLESDTFSQLLSTDPHISLRNEPEKKTLHDLLRTESLNLDTPFNSANVPQ